ncbi:MAG: hypothetical protein IMX04_00855 [Candidatus Carbobacillus altaicus]|nr:hypothetical protein [Candidatus Carbobacillus altaicus]
MIPIDGHGIKGRTLMFGHLKTALEPLDFHLNGGYTYTWGSFDRALFSNIEETYYLRIPLEVMDGALDEAQARVRLGQPFIQNHVVETAEAHAPMHPLFDAAGLSALWNQFQSPVDVDGPIADEDRWTKEARRILEKVRVRLDEV